ncbi:MAG TPA: hypothetical protein ENI94_05650 [Gammaproteobacteria bacterium]|nr:hypothetical protein [Gammaproteobacteria bacterium]
MMRGIAFRHFVLLAVLSALLAGCKAGLDTQPTEEVESPPVLTPELQAALDEGIVQAEAPAPPVAAVPAAAPTPLTQSPTVQQASESPRNDGIHDVLNESLAILQDPVQAMTEFPRDRRGEVDWVLALDEALIEPRADLLGQAEMQILDMDILMKRTQLMPWVLFSHSKHTAWLDCTNCHSALFKPKAGANNITMNAVLAGEFCGVCHGKVSFSLFVCERCHSVSHPDSGAKWW